jgi:hypothetical protein
MQLADFHDVFHGELLDCLVPAHCLLLPMLEALLHEGQKGVLYHDGLDDFVPRVAGQHFLQHLMVFALFNVGREDVWYGRFLGNISCPPFVHLEHSAIVDSVEHPALVGLELPAMGELEDPAMVGLELPSMVGLDRLLLPQLCLLRRSFLREWGMVFQELHEMQPELH